VSVRNVIVIPIENAAAAIQSTPANTILFIGASLRGDRRA
jgi:hypothetical protein